MKTMFVFIFSLLSFLACAQDFEIIKIDNTRFPHIELQIKTGAQNSGASDFTVYHNTDKLRFGIKEIADTNTNALKEVLVLIEASGISEDTVFKFIQKSTLNAISIMNRRDLLNIAYTGLGDSVNSRIRYMSAEFSADHRLIGESMFDIKFKKSPVAERLNPLLESIRQSIEFIRTRKNNRSDKALICLCGKETSANGSLLNTCISESKKYRIPIYIIAVDKIENKTEKIIAKLCSETGGVYTNTPLSGLDSAVIKSMDDVGLTQKKDRLYSMTFDVPKQGQFEIEYRDTKRKILINSNLKLTSAIRFLFQTPEYSILFIIVFSLALFLIFRNRKWFVKIFHYLKINKDKSIAHITTEHSESNPKASLFSLSNDVPITYTLSKDLTVIGRDTECHICLKDETVSKRHAGISYQNGKFYIHDEDSTNGIYVNGRKTEKTQLKKDDVIRIGKTLLKMKF